VLKKYIICCFLCLNYLFLFGVQPPEIIQQRVEYWMEKNKVESIDVTNLIENWTYLLESPLNLNTATQDELKSLQFLNEIQISELINHRNKVGSLLSIYELQSIQFWDVETIALVLPFVYVDEKSNHLPLTINNVIQQGKGEIITRLQIQSQKSIAYYPKNDTVQPYYLGNPDQYLLRFKYCYLNRLRIGLNMDKDPGEPFFKGGNTQGFDYYSAHIYYQGGKYIRSFCLGDYQIQIGQGLNLWTSYSFGKSLDIKSVKKNAGVISPHSSIDENRFLRGVAIDLKFKSIASLIFISSDKKDATLHNDSITQVSSVLSTGYHRTVSEIARKNKLQESFIGSYTRFEKSLFHIGIASVLSHFTPGINKEVKPYNALDFRGGKLLSMSADYSLTWRNAIFFGEMATTNYNWKKAFVQGVLVALDSKFSISCLFRDYDKAYQTRYNAGFSESNMTQNERGIYVGFQMKPTSKWNIDSYLDFFQFPWLKYHINAPSSGSEKCVQFTYAPLKKASVYFRYREIEKEKSVQQNFRIHFQIECSDFIKLQSRIELITLKNEVSKNEIGSLFFQDLMCKSKSNRFEFIFRYLLFDTDSYKTRIYTYEANPTYQYVNTQFYGSGNRLYVLVKVCLYQKMHIWLRFGSTDYSSQKSIGSGYDTVLSSFKNEWNLQFKWSF
jgi:hypothetical protein